MTEGLHEISFGTYAHGILQTQYEHLVHQEAAVLADEDPEPLHKMRVSCRRLRTALQVFAPVVILPPALSGKRVRDIAQILGELRDLDVQMDGLEGYYRPQLEAEDQPQIHQLGTVLQKYRRKGLSRTSAVLAGSRYRKLKKACETWLAQPVYTPLATRTLFPLVPYLLSPLLARLVLHPGWFLTGATEEDHVLHDLRKELKHARYQAEFLTPFYGEDFSRWLETVKKLQDVLGTIQDAQVLSNVLTREFPDHQESRLAQLVAERRVAALEEWDRLRLPFLNPEDLLALTRRVAHPNPTTA
ncbi:CHAD domain-containing protein [Anthocerotibacter panamensis]|uniref:CHAD domain-containing protein n=1 Tax=Anthocerotibacter panamensis TaxID=2857077 RepID=UPI001C40373A|nr:CHAD domain-containing protein [Anthocerotibacter panamensis]